MLIFSNILIKIFQEKGFIFGMLTELKKGTLYIIQVTHTLPIRHG